MIPASDCGRGQATVVGVAILLGVTVLGITALTATVGTVVTDSAASAETGRVAQNLGDALDPHVGSPHRQRIEYSRGALRTEARTVRLLDGETTIATREANAVIYEAGSNRVTYLAGALVRGGDGGAYLRTEPSVATTDGTLFVGVPVVGDAGTALTAGGRGVVVETRVTHARTHLDGTGDYGIAVETDTPKVWARFFEQRGATVTRNAYDEDGAESVVAHFPQVDETYLTTHELHLEVSDG